MVANHLSLFGQHKSKLATGQLKQAQNVASGQYPVNKLTTDMVHKLSMTNELENHVIFYWLIMTQISVFHDLVRHSFRTICQMPDSLSVRIQK